MASDIIARGIAAKAAADLKKTAADLEEFKEDTAEALAGKADLVDGKIPAEQLPSYVDDVVEYADVASFPATGEFGKIYVALDTGYTYRWSGTEYIQIGGQDLSIIVGNFAPTYDPSATYAEGDFCVHEGAFYVAVQNIDPAEPWDATHWDRTDIAAALVALEARLQAEIDTKQEILVSGTNIKTIAGKTVLGSGDLEITKSDVGLGNVDNTADLDKPISTAMQTALNLKADASALQAHEADVNNPHGVTKGQVGLGNVDNTSDLDKPISTATQAALDLKADASALQAHENDTSNPHGVTKAQVGLGNVDNTSDADKPVSTAQQTALNLKADATALSTHEQDTNNPHSVTKAQVGLGNVDNTADIDKPISTAQQAALDLKLNAADYVVDNALSASSENPVQNKVVKAALDTKVDEDDTTDLEFNDQPIEGGTVLRSITVDGDAYNMPSAEDLNAVTYAPQSPTPAQQGVARDNLGLGTAALKDTGTAAGNVPVLGQNGKLDSSVVPASAITDTFVVNSEVAMLALDAEVGDVAVRTDLNKTFILKEAGADVLAHWQELLTPTDAVSSVNGKTGVVVLDKADVGLGNVDDTSDLDKPISTAVQAALDEKVSESDTTNFVMSDTQVANAPMLGSMTIGTDAYNIPTKTSDILNDSGFAAVSDFTASTPLFALTAVQWAALKTNHYHLVATADLTLPTTFFARDFARAVFTVDGTLNTLLFARNGTSNSVGILVVEEGNSLYELQISVLTDKAIIRCANIY